MVIFESISDPCNRIEETKQANPILAPQTAIVKTGKIRLGRMEGKKRIIGRVEVRIRISNAKRHINICER